LGQEQQGKVLPAIFTLYLPQGAVRLVLVLVVLVPVPFGAVVEVGREPLAKAFPAVAGKALLVRPVVVVVVRRAADKREILASQETEAQAFLLPLRARLCNEPVVVAVVRMATAKVPVLVVLAVVVLEEILRQEVLEVQTLVVVAVAETQEGQADQVLSFFLCHFK